MCASSVRSLFQSFVFRQSSRSTLTRRSARAVAPRVTTMNFASTARHVRTQRQLNQLLKSWNGASYKRYRELSKQFFAFDDELCRVACTRVQSDPFATASVFEIQTTKERARVPFELIATRRQRVAAADFLLRRVARVAARSIRVDAPSQHILVCQSEGVDSILMRGCYRSVRL